MFYVLSVVAVLALLYLFLESYNAFVEARKLGERDARDGQPGRSKADISRNWNAGAFKAFLFLVVLLGTPLLFDYLAWWHLPASVPLSQAYFKDRAVPPDDAQAKLEKRIKDLDDKIHDLKGKTETLDSVVSDLKKKRDGLLADLKKEGISSLQDVKGKPQLEDKANELSAVAQKWEFYNGKLQEYSAALNKGRQVREDLGRQQKLAAAGISEQALEDAQVTITLLEEKNKREPGNPEVDPLRKDRVLDKLLGAKE
jgi:hypothetical protein